MIGFLTSQEAKKGRPVVTLEGRVTFKKNIGQGLGAKRLGFCFPRVLMSNAILYSALASQASWQMG